MPMTSSGSTSRMGITVRDSWSKKAINQIAHSQNPLMMRTVDLSKTNIHSLKRHPRKMRNDAERVYLRKPYL